MQEEDHPPPTPFTKNRSVIDLAWDVLPFNHDHVFQTLLQSEVIHQDTVILNPPFLHSSTTTTTTTTLSFNQKKMDEKKKKREPIKELEPSTLFVEDVVYCLGSERSHFLTFTSKKKLKSWTSDAEVGFGTTEEIKEKEKEKGKSLKLNPSLRHPMHLELRLHSFEQQQQQQQQQQHLPWFKYYQTVLEGKPNSTLTTTPLLSKIDTTSLSLEKINTNTLNLSLNEFYTTLRSMHVHLPSSTSCYASLVNDMYFQLKHTGESQALLFMGPDAPSKYSELLDYTLQCIHLHQPTHPNNTLAHLGTPMSKLASSSSSSYFLRCQAAQTLVHYFLLPTFPNAIWITDLTWEASLPTSVAKQGNKKKRKKFHALQYLGLNLNLPPLHSSLFAESLTLFLSCLLHGFSTQPNTTTHSTTTTPLERLLNTSFPSLWIRSPYYMASWGTSSSSSSSLKSCLPWIEKAFQCFGASSVLKLKRHLLHVLTSVVCSHGHPGGKQRRTRR
ncbi:hypothetical protein HMI55_003931 [Coelomomyces lativittatus]|nr:hypothetical protein HMI55_003931 [Coelomomyces lativittatus]